MGKELPNDEQKLEMDQQEHDSCKPTKSNKLTEIEPDTQTMLTTFICDYCKRQFTAKSTLEQHIITVHNPVAKSLVKVDIKSLKCTKCDFKCMYMKQLENHALLHDEKRKFVCKTCGYRYKEKTGLRDHKEIHNETPVCKLCGYKSTSKFDMKLHQSESKHYECKQCSFKSADDSSLRYHMSKEHKQKKFQCEFCPYKAIKKQHLQMHQSVHSKEKPHECHRCDYKCSNISTLYVHSRIKHNEEISNKQKTGVKRPITKKAIILYQCDFCGHKSADRSNFICHIKMHTRPYKCKHCDYRGANKRYFKDHVRLKHSGENLYHCDFCDYKSPTAAHLKRHLNTQHTGEETYKCEMCNAEFKDRSYLNSHKRLKHETVKNDQSKKFECYFCDYKSALKSHVTRHLVSHTGEYPYKCDLCRFQCLDSSALKRHYRVHTGERPYKCEQCSYAVAERCNLKSHVKSKHAGR